jgi:hypothetical protein
MTGLSKAMRTKGADDGRKAAEEHRGRAKRRRVTRCTFFDMKCSLAGGALTIGSTMDSLLMRPLRQQRHAQENYPTNPVAFEEALAASSRFSFRQLAKA